MKRLSKSEREKQAAESLAYLRSVLPKGLTVYTALSKVSRSGMSRDIKCLIVAQDLSTLDGIGVRNISRHVALALEWPLSKEGDAVRVSGCGMDMGFHLVYSLARVLFGSENGKDGGYSLTQRWI